MKEDKYWDEKVLKNVSITSDIGKPLIWNRYVYEEMFEQLDKFDVKKQKILDAGCGMGIFSNYFKQRNADVIGVDFSKEMIQQA